MLNRLHLIPLRAYPTLIRYTLRRWGNRPLPPPELSDADLDFFLGGTDAVEQRLTQPIFRFFSAADFGPLPTLAECDSILAHRIPLLGETFAVGDPVRWRCDFRTGFEWSGAHLSQLQLVTTRGDVKMPWELSRFQHGLTLALGYVATGDERYPREWASQFHAWRADNPPEHGPNWGNAMEAAIRAANWIAAFEFLRPALDRATGEAVLKALIQHGRFIALHLEEYWPPTNHLLANLCGLIWIGLCLRPTADKKRASPEPARWLNFGWRELQKQLRIQILPDGASYEVSTAYHRFVTEMVSSTVSLCALNQVFLPPKLLDTVVRMESVLAGLRKPDGTLPLFGDEDGGRFPSPYRGKPPTLRFGEASRGVGVRGVGWTSFPHAGWYVYRNSDEYLAIRAGDNGQAGWGGHAHNDALSFKYAIGSRTFFVDPGSYIYTSDPETRNLFRSTAYHNALRVDGQEISRIPPGELFRLENDVRVKVNVTQEAWEGEHSGYRRLGVIHRRRFEKRENGWLISDAVTGSGEHRLEWFFHFAPGCSLRLKGQQVWTEFHEGPNIQLEILHPGLLIMIEDGWVSPTYGLRKLAPVVKCELAMELPAQVDFSLVRWVGKILT